MIPNNSDQYLPGTVQIPSSLLIVGMTQSFQMVITISVDPVTASNTYQTGQLVRLTVFKPYGMYQANGLTAEIISVNGNAITTNVDSTLFDPFTIPSTPVGTPASLAPSGSRNLQFNNTTGLVPFQSLNDRGN